LIPECAKQAHADPGCYLAASTVSSTTTGTGTGLNLGRERSLGAPSSPVQQLQDEKARAPITVNKMETNLNAFIVNQVLNECIYCWKGAVRQEKTANVKKGRLIQPALVIC